ncbi:MAG: hypothetical protein MJZ29_04385 [Bacteroidaceae bacterium]|nr:hypothetical protein [Bacteroidaceae bacterium]
MNLPSDFITYTKQLFGDELWAKYLASFEEATPVSIRLSGNTTRKDVEHLPIDREIPWSSKGYYLKERPVFTLDPLLHAGAYYVQEASSQYLDEVLRKATEGLEINYAADFCASPGGKSLIIKDYLSETATLVSNEFVRKRAWILAENMEKSALADISKSKKLEPTVIVTNNSTDEIARAGYLFDLIVCDVPCSGEGMFRKDHATIGEWSFDNVMKCANLQREIVSNAWACLREGGVLVYSTCTFNRYEDEDNMEFIVNELGGEIIVEPRKFIPGQDCGEGQFMVAFMKKGECSRKKAKCRLNTLSKTMEDAIDKDMPVCELSIDDALNYLRGNSITLSAEMPKGIVAVSYKGFILGTVKNIGSRANNRYPKEWRIKHL